LNNADPNLEDDDDATYNADHVPTDLLRKVWSLVKVIRASGQRQALFNQVVLSGNDTSWWKNEKEELIMIKPLRFLHDIKTRWDSTYQMLVRIQMFKQVNTFPCSCAHL
jgi:hypothetical protein